MSNPFAAIETSLNTAILGAVGNAVVVIGAATVYGVFDDNHLDINGVAASGPALTMLSSDVSTVAYGSSLTVDSVSYTVTAIEPDGTGITVLRLQEA